MAADLSLNPASRSAARRWARRLAWALASLLLLWGLLWLALPPLLKWQIEKQGSALLGRTLTLDRVDLRPWSLSLALEGLRVARAAGDPADVGPQFEFKRLFVDLELQSLLRLAPVVDALRLEAPRLHLRHLGEGRLDVDDVIQRLRGPERPGDAPPEPLPRFAVFNIELVDGALDWVDTPVGVTHQLEGLHLAVPFLSNLGSRRNVVTEPRLAFTLNGSAFDSRASTTPFADDHRTRVRLQVPGLDVQPYLAYWPRSLPVQPTAARLSLDLTLDFESHAEPSLVLAGQIGLSDVRWAEAGQPVLGWQRLDLDLRRAEPLRQRVEIARIAWQGPSLDVSRDAQGRINLLRLAEAGQRGAPRPAAASASGAPAGARPAWQVVVDAFSIDGATVRWRDAAVKPAADLALTDLRLKATGLAWPVQQAAPVELDARLGDTPLSLRGSATDRAAQARLTLGELPLSVASPYLAQQLVPALDGRLQGEFALDWRAASGADAGALRLDATRLQLADLRLGPARAPLARLQGLTVAGAQVDLLARRAEVAQIAVQAPDLDVLRRADGRWMAQDWLRGDAATPDARSADAARPAAPAAPAPDPWRVLLKEVQLQDGRLRFSDQSTPQPVALAVQALSLRLQNLEPMAVRAPPAPISLRLQLDRGDRGRRAAEGGRIAFDGQLQLPGQGVGAGARGRAQVERLPLHAFMPYLADRVNFELLRADASLRGDVAVGLAEAGATVELAVEAALEDLRAQSLNPNEELLAWKSLQVRGLRVRSAPGQAASVQVAETVLSDYFARVLIDEQGRINLQGLLKPPPEAPTAATAPAAAPAAPATAAPATATAPSGPTPDIRVGPISLVNGRVRFSDRFVRPNYTANLSEVTGSLSAFSNRPPAPGQPLALAELSLKGRAEGTATLDVSGQINPLAQPLAMDVRGLVRDLELSPLSPYSAKYAGYGIERGKLSMDVRYRIQPDGQLDASNQIVLNQLSFGERDPNSSANLPVKLAVALLADRDGVIDINLPISGSLNDPQFRLGPVIVRVIVNLIGKAITAPFSLIANAFAGGGADASQIDFEPGRATLDDNDRRQLEAVARALQNRPALRLTIHGHAELASEREGWQRARLDSLLRAEKRRRLARAGAEVPAEPEIVAAERDELLREVYRRADIPKPRNAIGLAKDIPPAEMAALLAASQVPGDDAMRDLAVARAVAVKDFLLGLKLGEDRVFLGAPRLGPVKASEATETTTRPQLPSARAELQLAPR
ncbi:DUF748 domain-containing protein [Hydrogenophaga sp.]|uniref:DUF748 domain-containing protein n=1 Tax=Hydrogenophaga sp. TaxID=1904254 RepID=UPI00257AF253|nr:DUF748 domain-containing protein [Hydrogenophaga sp.]